MPAHPAVAGQLSTVCCPGPGRGRSGPSGRGCIPGFWLWSCFAFLCLVLGRFFAQNLPEGINGTALAAVRVQIIPVLPAVGGSGQQLLGYFVDGAAQAVG